MTSRDFCYWLQGWFELSDAGSQDSPPSLSAAQTETVRRHLAMVFAHEIDPAMGDQPHQDTLTNLHADVSAVLSGLTDVVLTPTKNNYDVLGLPQTSISGRPNDPVRYRC